jgi:hypothetical protein
VESALVKDEGCITGIVPWAGMDRSKCVSKSFEVCFIPCESYIYVVCGSRAAVKDDGKTANQNATDVCLRRSLIIVSGSGGVSGKL